MLVEEKTSIYHAIELSLREISYAGFVRARAHLHALMTQKSCAVRMRNAKLGNHSSAMHCAPLLSTIFASLARGLGSLRNRDGNGNGNVAKQKH